VANVVSDNLTVNENSKVLSGAKVSGNVGTETTAPQAVLHIDKANTSDIALRLSSTVPGMDSKIKFANNRHTVKSSSVTVKRTDKEYKGEYELVARRTIPIGSKLFNIEGVLTEVPTRYSVQVGRTLHIDIPESYGLEEILDQFYWRFMNHSCEPNALIRGKECFALRHIEPSEEITFNYNTTEYELAEPFDCRCGNDCCGGKIRGFRFLPYSEQERLRPWLADHLLSFMRDNPGRAGIVDDSKGDQVVDR